MVKEQNVNIINVNCAKITMLLKKTRSRKEM